MSKRKASITSTAAPSALLGDIRALIEASRQRVASTVNAELTLLFWRIGQRIHTEVLAGSGLGTAKKSCRPWPSSLSATTGAASRTRTCAEWCSSPLRTRTNQLS